MVVVFTVLEVFSGVWKLWVLTSLLATKHAKEKFLLISLTIAGCYFVVFGLTEIYYPYPCN
jgi:hypothetical protein